MKIFQTISGFLVIAGTAIMALNGACTQTSRDKESATSLLETNVSSTKDVEIMNKMTVKEQLGMYWKFFFEKGEKFPATPLPQKQLSYAELFDGQEDILKSSWLGHSSVLINIDGFSILTDPVFTRKVSLVGPTRFNRELVLDIDDIPALDVVIISHDHYDHLNKSSVLRLSEKTAVFIVPLGVGKRLTRWGVEREKVVELGWWESFTVHPDLVVTATPAKHFSGRSPFDRNETLWASWVIKSSAKRIFFSGDSGYFDGFKTIGEKFGPFDVTFLECGAYNKNWSNVHMMPEQTIQAFFDLKGKILQPIHWATFNLAFHPWYEPMERLTSEAWRTGASISTPSMGAIVDYTEPIAPESWWVPAMERSRQLNPEPAGVGQSCSLQ